MEIVDLVCDQGDIHLERSVNHDADILVYIFSLVGLVIDIVGLVDDEKNIQLENSVDDAIGSLKYM